MKRSVSVMGKCDEKYWQSYDNEYRYRYIPCRLLVEFFVQRAVGANFVNLKRCPICLKSADFDNYHDLKSADFDEIGVQKFADSGGIWFFIWKYTLL